jgi:hypothetical protein
MTEIALTLKTTRLSQIYYNSAVIKIGGHRK